MKSLTIKKVPPAILNALGEYARQQEVSESEAALDLIVRGLKVPEWYGAPRNRHDPLDDLLDGVLTKPYTRERRVIKDKVARQRPDIVEEWKVTDPRPTSKPALPIMGYDDVTRHLDARARENRKIARENAKTGAFDEVMDGLDLALEDNVAVAAEDVSDVTRAEAPPVTAASGAPTPEDEEPEPFGTRPADESSAPAKRVWDPVNGVAVEIIPQRGFSEKAIPTIDDQLHAALRSRSPAPAGDEEPAEMAGDSDILRTFAQASNLKRSRGNF